MSEIDKIINRGCNFQSMPPDSYVKHCSEIVNSHLAMSNSEHGISTNEINSMNEALLSINVFNLFRPSWKIIENNQFPYY